MRKRLVLGTATAVVAPVLAATPASAAATVETLPFDFVAPCGTGGGEDVALSGELLVVTITTETPRGGFVASTHFQPQGLTGTGTLSGALYRATGLTRGITVTSAGGAVSTTTINRFHLQGLAGTGTLYATQTLHFTVTPDGRVAVDFDKSSFKCTL